MSAVKKINIAYIIDTLNIGGTEKQLIKQIQLLESKGYRQTVICLRPSKFVDKLNLPCDIHVLDVYSLFSYNGFRKFIYLIRMFRKLKINIVQTYFIDSNIFGVCAAKFAGVDKIISCRRDMGFWYTPRILTVLRWLNCFVDRILVNSEAIRENVCKLEKTNLKKIDVLYNGIDLEPFKESFDDELLKNELDILETDMVIGIVANLNRPVKRVDLFIEAAAILLRKLPNTSFVIVGGGHLTENLKKRSVELGVQKRLHFVGLQENIYTYLKLFDIGILTSESEGFSNSIIEYMAAGLPVVCFDSGGNRELIRNGENGFLAEYLDASDLASKIGQIAADESLRKTIASNNLDKVSNYSWQIISKKTNEFYRTLLEF